MHDFQREKEKNFFFFFFLYFPLAFIALVSQVDSNERYHQSKHIWKQNCMEGKTVY